MTSEQPRPTDSEAMSSLEEETRAVPLRPMFFSFGMFIIDEIEYLSTTQPTKHNLLGGAGLYALMGARLISPPPFSTFCSWILDAGSDFPKSIASQIESWGTSTRIRHDALRLTTRAWNGYGAAAAGLDGDVDSEYRAFKYLTPKLRLDVEDLDDVQVTGRGWHMVCSPARCAEIVRKLRLRRDQVGCIEEAVVVWEPIPDLCTPAELTALRDAARGVDVVSPNAAELRAFFEDGEGEGRGEEEEGQDELVARLMGWDLDEQEFEGVRGDGNGRGEAVGGVDGDREDTRAANITRKPVISTKKQTACIVREGKSGSTIYFAPSPSRNHTTTTTNTSTKPTKTNKVHLPAYHTKSTSSHVLDPTGGGNTYLGALALSLAYTYTSQSTTSNSNSNPSATTTSQKQIPPTIKAIREFATPLFETPTPTPTPLQSVSVPTAQFRLSRDEFQFSRQRRDRMALLTAGIAACIAAGYAIEQSGVPVLTTTTTTATTIGQMNSVDNEDGATEVWNDEGVLSRVRTYLEREGAGIREEVARLLD